MTENPYQPPTAQLSSPLTDFEVPQEVAKKIRYCWIAGLITVVLSIALITVALMGNSNQFGLDAWAYADAVVMAALSFGVYKKSRTCAILLFSLFLLNKILMWQQSGQLAGLPLSLALLWIFGQGIAGTFQYHKLLAQHRG